jgi:E3 ubiquitin-protein ligase RNF144
MSTPSGQQVGRRRRRARRLDDRPPEPDTTAFHCVICHSASVPKPDGVEFYLLPCSHYQCNRCLGFAFNMAVRMRPFQPARCCSKTPSIDPEILRAGVDAAEIDKHMDTYLAQLDEHNCRDKLYCHVQTCSAFIPVEKRSHRVGTCPKCAARTCKKCRAKSHWGVCSAEQLEALRGDEQLLALAGRKNWKQCPDCSVMVERAGGCPHMM